MICNIVCKIVVRVREWEKLTCDKDEASLSRLPLVSMKGGTVSVDIEVMVDSSARDRAMQLASALVLPLARALPASMAAALHMCVLRLMVLIGERSLILWLRKNLREVVASIRSLLARTFPVQKSQTFWVSDLGPMQICLRTGHCRKSCTCWYFS